ncbi:3'-5' exonuclease domain-containing protein 2 [Undibacterium sp. FT79W]|uniref:3'-5' exonuclease n=1 Tax=Undibacterium sp. FT79W TaxID=2762296 RepID=UPI00164CDA61|nr:3'-5' exonuclease [Undibacterium sp. FT79W]MBC3876399.1 3'-5' exonuclease domain-containing protein 2 [Undibacterium sp. FT79W]
MMSEQETTLPLYPGIAEANIHIVADAASAAFAHLHLSQASVLGFDTETKPVFQKGQRHQGPHLIQLATETKAFLFPVVQAVNIDVVKAALEAQHILKVGFGLSDDLRHLKSKLDITTTNVLDLAKALRENRHQDMGAKAAVAKFFGMQLSKSKKTSTSNWAQQPLTDKQIAYAANDAHVALLVYQRWLTLQPAIRKATTPASTPTTTSTTPASALSR